MVKVQYREFDSPTQVAYYDFDGGHWAGGIAFGTQIICGCCGGTLDIDEIYEFAPEGIDPIRTFSEWVDISAEIIGYDSIEELDKTDET